MKSQRDFTNFFTNSSKKVTLQMIKRIVENSSARISSIADKGVKVFQRCFEGANYGGILEAQNRNKLA